MAAASASALSSRPTGRAAVLGASVADGEAAQQMAQGAAAAGLAWPPKPWAASGSLAERLAERPFLMAPMAGVTDAAYRLMARAGGAALAYSEMVSVTGIHYKSAKTWQLVDPNPAEPELAVQLFGSDVEHFREAATLVAERLGDRLALVDVNMACPVPKVTRSGAGSALLDDPARAEAIVQALRHELDVPVTVKIRIGRVPGRIVGPEFARAMEAAGADAVAVHGRVASQQYRHACDAGEIQRVVEAVTVPVIASGDALDAERAAALLSQTGAAACFVARGSYGNPWVFAEAARVLQGELPCAPTPKLRLAALRLHVRLLGATGAHVARARSLAGWYLRGVPDAAAWRKRAMQCCEAADYLALADELEQTLPAPECTSAPNHDQLGSER